MNKIIEHHCRICGLYMEVPPWGEDGDCPTHDICICCNVEFGYEDYTIESAKNYRSKWLNSGANWSDLRFKPENWNKEEQLKNIPKEFL